MCTSPAVHGDQRLQLRLGRALLASAAAIFVVLLLLGFAAQPGPGAGGDGPAPAFTLPLIDGGTVTNADFAGQVTVINVWASWCGPCREEAPVLDRVYRESDRARVAFLGVTRNDRPEDSREFIARFDIAFPSAIGDDDFASAYGLRGVPMTFVVAADGTLVARYFGPISESRLRALIADALQRSPLPPAARSGTGA